MLQGRSVSVGLDLKVGYIHISKDFFFLFGDCYNVIFKLNQMEGGGELSSDLLIWEKKALRIVWK